MIVGRRQRHGIAGTAPIGPRARAGEADRAGVRWEHARGRRASRARAAAWIYHGRIVAVLLVLRVRPAQPYQVEVGHAGYVVIEGLCELAFGRDGVVPTRRCAAAVEENGILTERSSRTNDNFHCL